MYTQIVAYEWDPRKASSNRKKHGVVFAEAIGVFDDDLAITIQDDVSDIDEVRFVTLDMGTKGRPSEDSRIIFVRQADVLEREQYQMKR